MTQRLVAIIRLAGKTGLKKGIKDGFKIIRLYKKNTCVIVPNTDSFMGMLKNLSSYTTWGEIDEPTLKLLFKSRGKIVGNKPLTDIYTKEKISSTIEQFASDVFNFKKKPTDIPGLKLFFRLKPPQGGFERKGVRQPFSLGGAFGYRKEKINDLIKRMI